MLNRLITVSCFLALSLPALLGQAVPTASRRFDLQAGGGFVFNNADYPYDPKTLEGFALYTTLDVSTHFGGEFVFHKADSSAGDGLYQKTYEIGPRYHRTYGRFSPYVKAMYGRGVFGYPNGNAILAYNMFAGGAGVDIRILPFLNLRGDYEYQHWLGFSGTGLTPQLVTIGMAYHFPADLQKGKHY